MGLQTANPMIAGSPFYDYTENPTQSLGAKVVTENGRIFRYVKAGATALVTGDLYAAPSTVANHTNLTPTAANVIGSTSVTVTLGATAATANQYAGGLLVIATGTGAGYAYEIDSHPAAALSTTLTLTLKDPIRVATTTATSKIDLIANPFNGVIIAATTATAHPVGVAVSVIPANYYGWVQSGGLCPILDDGNIAVGQACVQSNGTTGAVEDVNSTTQPLVGNAAVASSSGEYGCIWLIIDT